MASENETVDEAAEESELTMASERNALAELASRLNPDRMTHDDLDMAQRIVAELAKVSDGEWVEDCGGMFYLCRAESRVVETSVGRCREIAEEGNNKMTEQDKEKLRRVTIMKELKSFQTTASANVAKAADLLIGAMGEYCRHTSCETECCVGKRGCKAFNRKMRDYLEGIKVRFAIAEEGAGELYANENLRKALEGANHAS